MILSLIFSLVSLLFLIRFLLQAAGADFYNPISQAIVKATDPVTKPLRALLKPYRNLDFASILAAWLVCVLYVYAAMLLGGPAVSIGWSLLAGLTMMVLVLVQFYTFVLLIVVIASFISQGNYHPGLALLHQLVEPLLAPIRRILPSLGPIDISPIVLFLVLAIIRNALPSVGGL